MFSAILEAVDLFDGFAEVAAFDNHDHVDRVEVLLTTETSCQVGLWVCCRVEFRALRTKKPKVALRDLARQTQEVGDELGYGDVVSQCSELFL
jgi:hypothetical protein